VSGLWGFVLRRIGFGLVTLVVISLLVFLGVEALPGDLAQAILGQAATPETLAAFRKQLGLDLPAHVRYLHWIGGVLQGDFGTSLGNGRPIFELLSDRLWNTVFLASVSALIAMPLAVVLGLVSALYHERAADRLLSLVALILISFPEFFVGYILIAILSIKLELFPAVSVSGPDASLGARLQDIALPALTLTFSVAAYVMRMTRAAVIGVLSKPYIEMAHLKGIAPARVVLRHALPNALAPIINVVVLNLAYLIVGVVVVEVVFAYPGLGQLLVDAVSKRDLPLVQVCCLIFASTYVILNLIADVLSILANPRLRRRR
jgi:peptide/nickel transport system permease protein